MAQDFVFVATLGQTDVQVIVPDAAGPPRRYLVHKGSQRAFHEACEARLVPWRLRPLAGTEAIPEERGVSLEYDPARRRLVSPRSETAPGRPVSCECADGVELCAPLLADACRQLAEQVSRGALGKVLHVLLLTTRREQGGAGEPVAAAHLVRGQLAAALGLAPEGVEEFVFLTEPDLYETDQRGQKHLRVSVARRLDGRVRELHRQYPKAAAVVSEVAGIPEAKAVLGASAAYRFDQVIFIRSTEPGRESHVHRRVLVPPAESLSTRAMVARLVRRGGFDDAAVLAGHSGAEDVYRSEPWRAWLADVVAILEGTVPADEMERKLARAPRCRTYDCLRWLLGGGPALRLGFRVESALQRQNWSWALRETYTFQEVAWVQALNQHLGTPGVPCMTWGGDVFYPQKARIQRAATREYLGNQHPGKDAVRMVYEHTLSGLLEQELPEPARKALQALAEALDKVRYIRNAATHGCLESGQLEKARQRLEAAGVWAGSGDSRFLAGAPAGDVLRALGVPDAPRHYADLVEAILADLDDYSFLES